MPFWYHKSPEEPEPQSDLSGKLRRHVGRYSCSFVEGSDKCLINTGIVLDYGGVFYMHAEDFLKLWLLGMEFLVAVLLFYVDFMDFIFLLSWNLQRNGMFGQ